MYGHIHTYYYTLRIYEPPKKNSIYSFMTKPTLLQCSRFHFGLIRTANIVSETAVCAPDPFHTKKVLHVVVFSVEYA